MRPSPDPRPSFARLGVFVFLGFVWFTAAFLGGYLLGQADALTGNRGASELAFRAAQAVGLHPPVSATAGLASLNPDEQARFRIFWEAWNLLNRDFYDRAALDGQRMTYGAVKGLVESLADPHTAFSTPREKQLADASLRGTFDGIGIQIDQRDAKIQVVAPIEGSPAQLAGVRAGDVITRVDGKDLKGLPLSDVVLMIRGPKGTAVTLTITRAGGPEPLELALTRAEIKVQNVRTKLVEGEIGYLRIGSFTQSVGADTAVAIKTLLQQGARGIVLDLRSNPGGFLNGAVDVASQFIGDGVVLYQQGTDGQRQEYRARAGGLATSLPVVVLIDKGSASASEIVAAALRDNGRAVLVGEKSYGKGSVQSVHTLSDSSGLRVTSAIWLTPAGQPLERQGLEPGLAVATTVDSQTGEDAALDAAVQYLKTQALAEQPGRV